mmetsp:Transcript_17388/g.43723  ORF Transcript_17388/g.43723 Transcript_17388/m.43723 type:complete len:251 (-) Transcript_17388:954-1706(-)
MLGCASEDEMAASMTAIFSRFSAPLMLAGSTSVLIATCVPRHSPLYTLPNVPSPSISIVVMLSMSCALLLVLTASCRRICSMRSSVRPSLEESGEPSPRSAPALALLFFLLPAPSTLIRLYCRTSSASSLSFSSCRLWVVAASALFDATTSFSRFRCCTYDASTSPMSSATTSAPHTTSAIMPPSQCGRHPSRGSRYTVQMALEIFMLTTTALLRAPSKRASGELANTKASEPGGTRTSVDVQGRVIWYL